MKYVYGIALIAGLLIASPAYADEFSMVRCGTDIAKTLIDQKASQDRVVEIENRHKDLGLKGLGATGISDTLFAISWKICGQEYMLLEDDSIRDVLPFPNHSKEKPGFIGTCKVNGKDYNDAIVAILIREKDADDFYASIAWKIDEKTKRFVKISAEGLRCPSQQVFTEDGGP